MTRVFSVGDCPVCLDFGGVLILKTTVSQRLLFVCPMCGTAWLTPPGATIDAVDTVHDLAPNETVRLATPEDVRTSDQALLAIDVTERENWLSAIEMCLGARFQGEGA